MMRTFIDWCVLTLTLESAWFLVRPNVGMSPESIAELSTTKWGHNPHVLKSLSTQKADTTVGLGLVLMAFFLQMMNLSLLADSPLAADRRSAIFAALVAGGLVFSLSLFVSRRLSRRNIQASESALHSNSDKKSPQ